MPIATSKTIQLSGQQVAAIAHYLHIELLSHDEALKFICLDGEHFDEPGDAHSPGQQGGAGQHPRASCQNLSAVGHISHQDAVDRLIGQMVKIGPLA